jgi:hypothetical protein
MKRLFKILVSVVAILLVAIIFVPNAFIDTVSFFDVELRNSSKYYSSIDGSKEWKRLDVGPFTVDIPDDFRYIKRNSPEGIIGDINGGGTRIYFNHGSFIGYVTNLKDEDIDQRNYSFSSDTVNNTIRLLAIPKNSGSMSIQVEDYTEEKFEDEWRTFYGVEMMTSSIIYDEELVLNIFKTIRFKN